MPPATPLRSEVIKIYKGMFLFEHERYNHEREVRSLMTSHKDLLYLIRDYPLGYSYARPRLHKAFMSQAGLRDESAVREGIRRAEFVKKGMFIFESCF
jgi:hypothetical protein